LGEAVNAQTIIPTTYLLPWIPRWLPRWFPRFYGSCHFTPTVTMSRLTPTEISRAFSSCRRTLALSVLNSNSHQNRINQLDISLITQWAHFFHISFLQYIEPWTKVPRIAFIFISTLLGI
jgi:hypothetical protein